MKGLEALEKYKRGFVAKEYEIIEKELKALEILKKALCKKDDLELAYYNNDGNKSYYIRIYAQVGNDGEFFEEEITPEEYDLLKEVLIDGK